MQCRFFRLRKESWRCCDITSQKQCVLQSLVVLAWALCSCCSANATDTDEATQPEQLLRAIAEASRQSRSHFSSVTCSFTIAVGTCEDENTALDKGPLNTLFEGRGVINIVGPQVRFEIVCDVNRGHDSPDLGHGSSRRSRPGSKIPTHSLIWNGDKGIVYSPQLKLGNLIYRSETDVPLIRITPFDLVGLCGENQSRSPDALIGRSFEDKTVACSPPSLLKWNNRQVYSVRIDKALRSGSVSTNTFYFDRERNGLPIGLEFGYVGGKGTSAIAFVADAKQFSNNRWFPTRILKVVRFVRDGKVSLDAWELKVENLEIDIELPDDALRIELPSQTLIQDSRYMGGKVGLREKRSIGFDDLSKFAEQIRGAAEMNDADAPVVPKERP